MPTRPPKKWFYAAVRSIGRHRPGVDDPEALAAWIWHHGATETTKREILRAERAWKRAGGLARTYNPDKGRWRRLSGGKRRGYFPLGPRLGPTHYTYYIDLDERGEFRADVRDENDKAVFDIDGYEIFEDGFMRDQTDMRGLLAYMIDLGIAREGDSLSLVV
jgi:hypothetical protein